MSDLAGARLQVVGAGVVGLCVAIELRSRGADVLLIDEEAAQPNASAVAAGMIAPAFEAALEEAGQGRLALLRAGRDLWPEMADGAIRLRREGALAVADGDEQLERIAEALRREGALHDRLSAEEARRLQPGLRRDLTGAVFSPEDWRVEAGPSLRALADHFLARGGRRMAARPGPAALAGVADAVIICAGWGARAFAELAPELTALQPIKGQLARFAGVLPFGGPTVRGPGGYLAPSAAGVIAGASMEAGRDDLALSLRVQARLAAGARALFPHLAGVRLVGTAGVRAATPDGLPLVGRSRSGIHLATGFRRNGWLLAPLAARITADQLAGRDPGPWAAALRPERFTATQAQGVAEPDLNPART